MESSQIGKLKIGFFVEKSRSNQADLAVSVVSFIASSLGVPRTYNGTSR